MFTAKHIIRFFLKKYPDRRFDGFHVLEGHISSMFYNRSKCPHIFNVTHNSGLPVRKLNLNVGFDCSVARWFSQKFVCLEVKADNYLLMSLFTVG